MVCLCGVCNVYMHRIYHMKCCRRLAAGGRPGGWCLWSAGSALPATSLLYFTASILLPNSRKCLPRNCCVMLFYECISFYILFSISHLPAQHKHTKQTWAVPIVRMTYYNDHKLQLTLALGLLFRYTHSKTVEIFKFGFYLFTPIYVMLKFGDPEWSVRPSP